MKTIFGFFEIQNKTARRDKEQPWMIKLAVIKHWTMEAIPSE